MAVNLCVALVEFLARGDKRRRRQPPDEQSIKRRAQLIALTGIAQVELAREAGPSGVQTLRVELFPRSAFQLAEDLLGMIRRDLDEWPQLRTDIVVDHVRAEETERREGAGLRRHQNAPH